MKTRDIMSAPVIMAAPGTPLKDVAVTLLRHRISAVPIVDREGKLCGIVSEADLLSLESGRDPHVRLTPASFDHVPQTCWDVMTADVITLPPHADVGWAAELMVDHHVKQIPITEDGRVVGVVSRRDLLQLLVRDHDAVRASSARSPVSSTRES